MILLALAGCLDLDGFVFNPVHCETVDDATCNQASSDWNRICKACDEPYDWGLDYPWFPDQLGPGQTIREPTTIRPLTIETTDGQATLDAYWIPSHGERAERANTTLVYNHGNFAGIEHYLPRVRVLHELGFNILVWDYRGYGKSTAGTPTGPQFLEDARLIRSVVDDYAPDPERVVIYAYSLGGIPAVEAALADPPCALVLEAPFTSMSAIAQSNATTKLPETFVSQGAFDNRRKLAGYAGPLFAMGGSADTYFPPEFVAELVDAATGPKDHWILPGVHHGVSDIGVVEESVPDYDAHLTSFFADFAPDCVGP